MLLEGAETILGYFGFKRPLYGYTGRKGENGGILRDEPTRDIDTERSLG
jgi:hypothetical protein